MYVLASTNSPTESCPSTTPCAAIYIRITTPTLMMLACPTLSRERELWLLIAALSYPASDES